MVCLLLFTILAIYIGYRLYQRFNPTPDIVSNGKYVLISGCDSGFGRGLAIELDRQGFNVLAGVLFEDNIPSLKGYLSDRSSVFRLDITNQNEIDQVFQMISLKTPTLHALVNNAGIGSGGLIDWISVESMQRMMDVNFFGHVRMTKTFLPLLIAKRDSRVVNICSVAGFLTKPGMSAYAASKHALESFSDCLRREMVIWGLRVSIIEPGFMRTNIVQGHAESLRTLWNTLSVDVKNRWGEELLEDQVKQVKNDLFMKYAEDPDKVVQALKHAVMNTVPQIRYRPGLQSSCLMFPLSRVPSWVLDWLMTRRIVNGVKPAGLREQLRA